MKNLAIIDSDSICYLGGKEDSLQQILDKVDYKIEEILRETNADYYVLLISKGKYFRHELAKDEVTNTTSYKANRTYGAQIWVQTIKEYLIAKYKAVWYPNLEADDLCSFLMGKTLYFHVDEGIITNSNKCWDTILNVPEVNKILVAKDKDLLYSIPGKHFNFSKKLDKDTWGTEWVETSECDANSFVKSQMIVGELSPKPL